MFDRAQRQARKAVERIIEALALLTILSVGTMSDSGVAPASPLSPAQEELVEFGLGRFAGQGLDLPVVSIDFHPSSLDCQGHKGLYMYRTQTLRMCSLDKKTMLHELAHAWARHNLTMAEMESFTRYRGVATWNDPADPWKERATEHAAEIVAWALMDRPVHLRLTVHADHECQRSEFRMLTIEDSTVEELYDGFLQLTGVEPIFRTPAEFDSDTLEREWQAKVANTTSPEARRLSTSEPHGERRLNFPGDPQSLQHGRDPQRVRSAETRISLE